MNFRCILAKVSLCSTHVERRILATHKERFRSAFRIAEFDMGFVGNSVSRQRSLITYIPQNLAIVTLLR